MNEKCEAEGHEARPGLYIVNGKRACRSCRNKDKREQACGDAPKPKPGPKPDSSKPYSRHGGAQSHHGKRPACLWGHEWANGSYKLSSDGKRICLTCIDERRPTHCPAEHEYTEESTYLSNGSLQCKTCRNERMRERRPASGIGAGGLNKAKAHCPRNHAYTEENTYVGPKGKRTCRTCALANGQAQRIKAHGITVEVFLEMLEAQDGKCRICAAELNSRSGQCIDHDHRHCPGDFSCGECIRGILCKGCNTLLGFAKDDVTRLLAAIGYLEQWKLAQQPSEYATRGTFQRSVSRTDMASKLATGASSTSNATGWHCGQQIALCCPGSGQGRIHGRRASA